MFRQIPVYLLTFGLASSLNAQAPTVSVDQAECLPIEENGLVTTSVTHQPGGSEVRVYFRRLHEEVEDFYYVVARPAGPESYWAVLPEAEDEELEPRQFERDGNDAPEDGWAEWWREKVSTDDRDPNDDLDEDIIRERASRGRSERRDWMEALDDAALQEWLETLENEPTEYFATIHDMEGNRIARSDMKVAEVRESCEIELTEQQAGEAENLTVGETAEWEKGERVFHWLCDGVVTRIDPFRVLRSDGRCRACIIAWWQKKEILIPAIIIPPTIVISTRDDPPVSPSGP